jgi:hypothetical protein
MARKYPKGWAGGDDDEDPRRVKMHDEHGAEYWAVFE